MENIFNDEDNRKNSKKDNWVGFDEVEIRDKNSKIKDKVTSLRCFLDEFQKRLEGYEYVSAKEKLVYTGRVLAGSKTIQKLVALLSPFAENTNLIGEVKVEEYYRKKYRLHSTVNSILLTSNDVPVDNYNTIMETFKSNFVNIGNVILSSKSLLKAQFMGEEKDPFLMGDA